MKKITRISIIVLTLSAGLCCLCACSTLREKQLTALASEESLLIREQSDEIIRCLTENDKEGFCALFCEKVRQRDTFRQEVDAVFDFFSCEVYIKAEAADSAGGGTTTEEGKRTEWYLTPEITYIEVLQRTEDDPDEMADRYYGVRYYWKVTDTEHPELEGLHHFEIRLLNMDKSVEVGTEEADIEAKQKQ